MSDVADNPDSTTNVGSTWAQSYDYAAAQLVTPPSIPALQDAVARTRRIRPLGSRHSFTGLADSAGTLVSLQRLPHDVDISEADRSVRFSAGILYGELAGILHGKGWAIHNLASLPHISVAGAVATGTHGSGDRNGTLSAAVSALDLVTASGDIVSLHRGDADFDGAVVALGSLGVVTRITLDIEPTFDVRQDVFEALSWDDILDDFDAVSSSAYSVSIFTNWLGGTADSIWLKSRLDEPAPPGELFGVAPLTVDRHMLPGVSPVNTTPQAGIAGPWNDRLAHFKVGFTPSNGDELQTEYLLPRSAILPAIEAMRALGPRIAPLLYMCELRTMRADSLWLSGAYGTDAVGIHFTWKKMPREVNAALALIEEQLLPLGGRPHWGKVFLATAAEVAPLYPRMQDFRELVARFDPDGKFGNDFLARHVLG